MKKCVIITDIAVWSYGAGHISRLTGLIKFLTKYAFLTVVYVGRKPIENVKKLLPPKVDLIFLENEHKLDEEKNIELVNRLLNFERIQICFIEYIHLSYFLRAIPDDVVSILDAHDIISERNKSFNNFNYDNWDYEMPASREFKIYQLYDKVMLISRNDYAISANIIGKKNLILAPHPVKAMSKAINPTKNKIGFIASDYLPNVDAICWFLKDIWPLILENLGLELHIFGLVCRKVPTKYQNKSNIFLRGLVHDLSAVYSELDIAINPVRIGSGMKIKNVEALAHGVPLITTSHGASGLELGIRNSFLVADSVKEFARLIEQLATDKKKYKILSENAVKLIKEEFSDERCFKQLKEILDNS